MMKHATRITIAISFFAGMALSSTAESQAIRLSPIDTLCPEAAQFYMAAASAAFGVTDQFGKNGRDTAISYGEKVFMMDPQQVDKIISTMSENKDDIQYAVEAIADGQDAQFAFSSSYSDNCNLAPGKYIPNYQSLVSAGKPSLESGNNEAGK